MGGGKGARRPAVSPPAVQGLGKEGVKESLGPKGSLEMDWGVMEPWMERSRSGLLSSFRLSPGSKLWGPNLPSLLPAGRIPAPPATLKKAGRGGGS